MSQVYIREYPAPPVDRAEIRRYLRAGVVNTAVDEAVERELTAALDEALPVLSYRVCYAEFALRMGEGECDLGFAVTGSESLCRHLRGCTHVTAFAATVGLPMDRLIARYSSLSPVRALCLQAVGTERIEALCDAFEDEVRLSSVGGRVHSRFSPGYGDLPLDFQRQMFALLDPARRIGLSLNDSLLMSPSKSVTAIVGIE